MGFLFSGDPAKAEKLERMQWKEWVGFLFLFNILLLLVD